MTLLGEIMQKGKKNTIKLTGPIGAKHKKYWIISIFKGVIALLVSENLFPVCIFSMSQVSFNL